MLKNLKSSMDRFIAQINKVLSYAGKNLKSSMDRFIGKAKERLEKYKKFKIQYG